MCFPAGAGVFRTDRSSADPADRGAGAKVSRITEAGVNAVGPSVLPYRPLCESTLESSRQED